MKKRFLVALATGLFLVGMGGGANALTLPLTIDDGNIEVGEVDTLLAMTVSANSSDSRCALNPRKYVVCGKTVSQTSPPCMVAENCQ